MKSHRKARSLLTYVAATVVLVSSVSVPSTPVVASTMARTSPFTPVVQPKQVSGQLADSYPLSGRLDAVAPTENDFAVTRGVTPFSDIAPRLNAIADMSDRVSLQVVGRSTQDRPLYLVTVTAPESVEATRRQNELRTGIASGTIDGISVGREYKTPIWFNSNIHGTEMEGTDASLEWIEELATSMDDSAVELLQTTRLYFTVSNNPDGRTLGERNTVGSIDGGIGGIDANRDGMTVATREAALLRDLGQEIQPIYFGDIHGYMGSLMVEPTTGPHNDSIDYRRFIPHAFASSLAIEAAVANANIPNQRYYHRGDPAGEHQTVNNGRIQIPYRDYGGGWDDWPPVFAPQYQALGGAVAVTIELPINSAPWEVANLGLTTPEAVRTNVDTAKVVMRAASTYVVENRHALLDQQRSFYSDAVRGEPIESFPADASDVILPDGTPREWVEFWGEDDVMSIELPRVFVLPAGERQRSQSDADGLVRQLLSHGVDVGATTGDVTIDGTDYPAGSYVVDMHQSRRGVANALLADGQDVTNRANGLYDMAAWSAGLLWGATVDAVGATTEGQLPFELSGEVLPDRSGGMPEENSYSSLELSGVAEYRAVNSLLRRGIAVSLVDDSIVVVGPDLASRTAVRSVSDEENVTFRSSDGSLLRTADTRKALSVPRVAFMTMGWNPEQEDRLALEKIGISQAARLNIDRINDGTLLIPDVDVLLLAGVPSADSVSQALRDEVTRFVAGGGSVVGLGSSSQVAIEAFGLLPTTITRATGGSTAIVRTAAAESSFLRGMAETAYVEPALWFTPRDASVEIEQRYAAATPFVSGFWKDGEGGRQAIEGQPSVVSGELAGGGQAILFGTMPTHRAATVGGFEQIGRALFQLVPEGAVVPSPEPPTQPTPEPSDPGDGSPAPAPTTGAPANGAPTNGVPPGSGQPDSERNSLASTGSPGWVPAVSTAALLLALGVGLVALTRRRSKTTRP